jgi:ribosomal protein L40E
MPSSSLDKLIGCIECGARISPDATACPKCETKHYRGVRCGLCKQIFKFSEASTWDKIDQHPVRAESPSYTFHRRCLETIVPDVLPARLPCKECAAFLNVSSVVQWSIPSGYGQSACTGCGSPRPFEWSSCERCSIPVVPDGHHCVLTNPRADTFGYLHGDGCYHATCYALHFEDLIENRHVNIFDFKLRYRAEYRQGALIRETFADENARELIDLRCERARKQGKRDVVAMPVNGPFVYFWGGEIQMTGIAKKSLGVRNLSGKERESASKLSAWGYSLFVSQYPFTLMVRL